MPRVRPAVCLCLLALFLAHAAPAVAAEGPPPGSTRADREVGLELGGTWTGDDWLAPSGVNYRVGGWVSRFALTSRSPWNGRLDTRLSGSRVPLFRTDSNEDVTRLGSQLLVTWSQGRFQQRRDEGSYQIDAGLGLMGDVQVHQGGVPRARARDYLDETQVRLGPVLRGDITWFHPTDAAWRANLTLLGMPRLLGITTGNVAYPGGWSGVEAAIGPQYQWGALTLKAGLEAKIWVGGAFVQRAGGLYVQGSQAF